MFSVVMSTYNAPRELDLALCGLSRQSRKPDELLIADDGSSQETGDVIASWSKELGFECRHIWHSDHGNRKTRILWIFNTERNYRRMQQNLRPIGRSVFLGYPPKAGKSCY